MFSQRLAETADADQIARVHYESLNVTFNHTAPEYVASRTLNDFENAWHERVLSQTSITNLLLSNNEIVGFVSAGPCRDEDTNSSWGSVDRIYLHPSVCEKGLGLQLLKWCENNLAERNFETAKLWVFEVNKRAIRFYERNGYKPDGNSKQEFGRCLLRYEKSL